MYLWCVRQKRKPFKLRPSQANSHQYNSFREQHRQSEFASVANNAAASERGNLSASTMPDVLSVIYGPRTLHALLREQSNTVYYMMKMTLLHTTDCLYENSQITNSSSLYF